MITQLQLRNFKKFKELNVNLGGFSVLMGENSSGKTTVLQSINLALLNFFQHGLITNDGGGKPKVRTRGIGATSLTGIPLSDYRELFYGKVASGGRESGAATALIALKDERSNIYRLQVTSLFRAFNLKCISTEADLPNNPLLQKKVPLYISGFVGLNNSEERVFPAALRDRLKSGRVSSILRNLLFDTQRFSPGNYESLKKRLSADFDFHLGNVSFDEENDVAVRAEYSEECDKKSLSLDFNASGSGFMQILQILAPIYRFCPNEADVVLLDEPDAHLHANMQTTLADTLRHIQKELGIQIIISTHSTSIIRSADPSEVIPISSHIKTTGPLTKGGDVESAIKDKLDAYYIAKSVLSGKIAFFEDTNTDIIERFDELLGTKVFRGPNTIPIVRGVGKSNKVPFQISNILKQLTGADVEVHFIRDGDAISADMRKLLVEYANTKKCMLHCLDVYEVESYLLSPNLIITALKKKFPNSELPTAAVIEERIINALKQTTSLAKFGYEDVIEEDIFHVGSLLNIPECRQQSVIKSRAKVARETAESQTSFSELLKTGMGKEALSLVLNWLNNNLCLNIGRKELIEALEVNLVPDEIVKLLMNLRSLESKLVPASPNATAVAEEEPDTLEAKVENMLFSFGQETEQSPEVK